MSLSKYFPYVWCLLIFTLLSFTGATTFRSTTLEKMVNESDMVIEGTCVEKSSRWVGSMIMTVADIEVHSVLSGSQSRKEKEDEKLQLTYVGGSVEEPLPLGQKIEGGVNLEKGDRAYLFLNRTNPDNRFYAETREVFDLKEDPLEVKSMARGVFKIEEGELKFNRWQGSFKKELYDKYASAEVRQERDELEDPHKGWKVQPDKFVGAVRDLSSDERE